MGFPGGAVVKNLPAMQRCRLNPSVVKIPWKRKWQPTLIFLPRKSVVELEPLEGYSSWGGKESDMI